MKRNFNLLIKYLEFLPVDLCYIDHIEADDIMAYAPDTFLKKKL